MRLSTDELMLLAPRLRGYLKTPTPAWPEIVDAAEVFDHNALDA